MHSVLISDNRDSLIGMKMAGIDGYMVSNPEECWEITQKQLNDPNIGIVFLTEKAGDMIEEKLVRFREKSIYPLITIIPDRHGFRVPNKITGVIKEAIGM